MSNKSDVNYDVIRAVRTGNLNKVKELINCYGLSYSPGWSQGYNLLNEALCNGQVDVAKFLLTSDCKVTSRNCNSYTPLHYAASLSEIELVENILNKGGNVHAKDGMGHTPLHNAVRTQNVDIIELLLKNGAKVNASAKNGITPIHMAVKIQCVPILEHLLRYVFSLKSVCTSLGNKNYTPLHFAVETNNQTIVEMLVNKGSVIDFHDEDDNTPLHVAAKNGRTSIVEYLLNNGASVDSLTSKQKYTPLHFACEQGHSEIVNILLNRGANVNCTKNNVTPLHLATKKGNEAIVKILLQHGAEVDSLDKEGKTALFIAVHIGHIKIIKNILQYCPDVNNKSNKSSLNVAVLSHKDNCMKIVEMLLGYGLQIDMDDAKSPKLLHTAVRRGYLNIIEDSLKLGANVNTLNTGNGFTLIHTAIENEQEEVTNLLISYEADINIPNKSGHTPIYYAIKNADFKTVQLLLSHGADIKNNPEILHFAVQNNSLEIVKTILQHGADINIRDNFGRTALHSTMSHNMKSESVVVEKVKLLLSKGANVDAQDNDGQTILHKAAEKGWENVVKVLLEYKANANISTKTGITALHYSAEKGNEEIIRMILSNGVEINAKGKDGLTPLQLAVHKGHTSIVKLLLENGAVVDFKLKISYKYENKKIKTTLLHVASENGDRECINIMLEHGLDIDCRDQYGRTALHIACIAGNEEAVKCLLDYGSDVNIKCKNKQTAADYALDGIDNFKYANGRVDSHYENYDFDDEYYCFGHEPDYYYLTTEGLVSPHEVIAEILAHHIIKLEAATLYVNDSNFIFINNRDDESNFEALCEVQIENMLDERIADSITYYDIVTESTISLANYMKNENIVQALKSDDYKSKFPIYASMIELHITKAMERNDLLEHVHKKFDLLCNNYAVLPYDCVEEILSYLSVGDLRNLIQACNSQ